MESWAQSERNPVNKAILHSLLAYEYVELMRKNRRVLLSRTLLAVDEVPEDIREWSISQFVDKIDRCNRASLQDSIRLLDTSAENMCLLWCWKTVAGSMGTICTISW